MKGKKITYFVIIAAALVIIGGGITAIGWLFGGKGISPFISKSNNEGWKVSSGEIIEGNVFIEEFDELFISTASVDIIIEEGTKFAFEYRVPEQMEPVVSQSGGKLEIKQPSANGISINLLSYGPQTIYYKLTVPQDIKADSDISSSSGEIDIDSVDVFGSVRSTSGSVRISDVISKGLDVVTSSGDIRIRNSSINDLDAGATSGEILISGCTTEKLSLESSSGSIKVEESTADETKIKAVSGEIEAEDLKTDSVKADSSSGDIELNLTEVISVECSAVSGSVKLDLPGYSDDYSFELDTVSGYIKVGNEKHDGRSFSSKRGNKPVEVGTSSGDITIDF